MSAQLRRRQLLGYSIFLPLACSGIAGCAARQSACVDPRTLSRGEEQMRKTLAYIDLSTEAEQRCDNCQFFHGAGDCGDCELLNGPVASIGYCNSWARSG